MVIALNICVAILPIAGVLEFMLYRKMNDKFTIFVGCLECRRRREDRRFGQEDIM